MNHLKHEAAAKVKAYSTARSFDGELEALRNRNALLAKRNATREKVITELKVCARHADATIHVQSRVMSCFIACLWLGLQEGSRILEDQLRLMDEKYNELRTRLEVTRSTSTKEVKRAQARADRMQVAVMGVMAFSGSSGGSM
jgi:hypothetical protein